MRRQLISFIDGTRRWLTRPTQAATIHKQAATIEFMSEALVELAARENNPRAQYMAACAELAEARTMAGSGPWRCDATVLHDTDRLLTEAARRFDMKESATAGLEGFGDSGIALLNAEWRRDVNLSWMEFSRWGIQQIILIARLHYIKNPIIRRLVDVCAAYVFARGCSVTSGDDDANATIQAFLEHNKRVLGHKGLCDLERRLDYDGNLFFVLFADTQDKGMVTVRTIDATEVFEVVCDPEDVDTPRFYKRRWTQMVLDEKTGVSIPQTTSRWYPALGYEPADKPPTIGDATVAWDSPVLHVKAGAVAKWHFGSPRMYPAIIWAKESGRYLESAANVAQALSQIALLFTTKGGQQALAGAKDQLGTTVNASGDGRWDTNPPTSAGGTFASGPGTTLQAFKTQGAGLDPEKVRQFKLQCCMVFGVPETFLGDVSTGNLATAQSLDRPTETVFLEKQEVWREILVALATFALQRSMGAPSGRLREALNRRKLTGTVPIREAASHFLANGRRVYEKRTGKPPTDGSIDIRAEFPAIREGDLPALVSATCEAMAPGGNFGRGIDEKEGVRKLYDLLGVENGDELVEEQYPEGDYDPKREPPEPVDANAGDEGEGSPAPGQKRPTKPTEAQLIGAAMNRLTSALRTYEASHAARVR